MFGNEQSSPREGGWWRWGACHPSPLYVPIIVSAAALALGVFLLVAPRSKW